MSEYERQVEEALARKSREAEEVRKKVQSEQQLISSLDRIFSENSGKMKKPAENEPTVGETGSALEKQLAESSQKKAEPARKFDRELEKSLAPDITKEAPESKPEEALKQELKEAGSRLQNEQEQPRQPIPEEKWLDINKANAAAASPAEGSEELVRYHSPKEPQAAHGGGRSALLAVLLAVLLTAAGISGGLYYGLFTYRPMADAVNNSACASLLEEDLLAAVNAEAGQGGAVLTRESLVGGQAIRDIKLSLKAAYSGGTFSPDCGKMSERIAAGAADSRDGEALAAKAVECYSSMIEAAPEATWFGQTGSLRLILLVVLVGSLLGSLILILLLARQGRGGNAAGFAFAGAALLLELLAIAVMATGVFRRYHAAYNYITVLSTRYMLGGIVACMVIGAFYMVMAVEAKLLLKNRRK